jgi:hypothetical protein
MFIETWTPRKQPNQRKLYPRSLQGPVAFTTIRALLYQVTTGTVSYRGRGNAEPAFLAKGLVFDQHHVGDGDLELRRVLQIIPYLLNTERRTLFSFFSGLSLLMCVYCYLAELRSGMLWRFRRCPRLFACCVSQSGAGVELELDSAKVKEKSTEPEMER